MRHRPLHSALRAFADDAATALAREVADGAEVPFELASEGRPRRTQLYLYRPLTGAFIRERLGVLVRLETYAPVARALLYRGCPFVFITGFSDLDMLPADLRGYRVLHKPVDRETVCSAICTVPASRAARSL